LSAEDGGGLRSKGLVFATIRRLRSTAPVEISGGRGEALLMNFCRTAGWRPRSRSWISIAAAGLLCAFTSLDVRAASVQPLEIVTKSGVQVFSVEMATTEEEKTTGLMYRKELADGKGMLFDFSPEQEVSMWMKNTYIPLDMIFIRADGRILRIAENTEPMSTKIIPSRGLAKGVLEVIAGTAQKYGIAPGDRVAHPLFNGR
jgi:uncharacterized membrane protein (UPF0127 family)